MERVSQSRGVQGNEFTAEEKILCRAIVGAHCAVILLGLAFAALTVIDFKGIHQLGSGLSSLFKIAG